MFGGTIEHMQRAAVWIRVSTDRQETANQTPEIEQFAKAHGYQIVKRYELHDSAWNGGGADYQRELKRAEDDAWAGKFQVLIVWALDRITRSGAEDALRTIRRFRERGANVVSVRESWLNGSPEVVDVLVAFAGWQAEMESRRKSERVKAGIERRRAQGLPLGRPPGSKDTGKRKKAGYFAREERKREARKSAES